MKDIEKDEALMAIVGHYGLQVFLEQIDVIVDRIAKGVMSVPLDKDPEKAAIALYAERMKAEGAMAVKMAIARTVDALKSKATREKKNG